MFDGFKETGHRRSEKRDLHKKQRQKKESPELTEGLVICPELMAGEKRIKTLLVKGGLVYLLVMGVMGAYLSSLDEEFSWGVMHVIVFLCSLYCACLFFVTAMPCVPMGNRSETGMRRSRSL